MTTNEELMTKLNGIRGSVSGLHDKVNILHDLLKASSPPPPPNENDPVFSSGKKGTGLVQIIITTRLRLPRTDKNGNIMYTDSGSLKHYKPLTTRRVKKGDVILVHRPHIQGDGTRLWEVVSNPGQFLRDARYVSKLW